ncbi:MAG: class I SAM-dependent DNA methyltransferase [Phycisphaerae bacterium]
MGRSRRAAVQKYHDRVADRYDHSYDDAYWRWHDALTWDYLKPFLPRSTTTPVLDLGCGTGKWAAKLVKSGYHVTCVDISPRMLDRARARIARHDLMDNAAFIHADLCDLSMLPEARFGLAVAMGEPIGCSSSPARAMKQIRKRLAVGGVLVATFDNRFAAIDHYLQTGSIGDLARFLRHGKTHWLTANRDEQFPIHTFSLAGVKKLGDTCGFQTVDAVGKTVLPMRRHRDKLADPGARRAWADVERRLARDADAIGRAAHIQIAFRRVG